MCPKVSCTSVLSFSEPPKTRCTGAMLFRIFRKLLSGVQQTLMVLRISFAGEHYIVVLPVWGLLRLNLKCRYSVIDKTMFIMLSSQKICFQNPIINLSDLFESKLLCFRINECKNVYLRNVILYPVALFRNQTWGKNSFLFLPVHSKP